MNLAKARANEVLEQLASDSASAYYEYMRLLACQLCASKESFQSHLFDHAVKVAKRLLEEPVARHLGGKALLLMYYIICSDARCRRCGCLKRSESVRPVK